jgi:OOP family OmpA-OmpF porin
MASKKFALLTSLMLTAATGGFSQLGGILNYQDSTKVPAKRMAQQNEWANNSKDQPFPAKPRDMWQLGIYGGAFIVNGDASPYPGLPGWNIGAQVRKSLGYVFSVRGQVGYGISKGLDYKKNPNLRNNAALAPYFDAGGPGFYVHNFKTTAITPSVDILASLNNLMFHRKSNKVNVYVLGGVTEFIYKTKLDLYRGAAGANNIYNVGSINFNQPRKDIKKDLKDLFDGDYETNAMVNDRAQNFSQGEADKWQVRHSWDIGTGIEIKASSRVSIGAEIKYVITQDDYIDGWKFVGGTSAHTPQDDNLIFGNLSLNFNLGSAAKRVAPLWWINPLGYAYSELNNPSHMKFPKPVLDDTDGDGVTDQFDIEPNTPAGCPVDTKGKSRDTDGDGVPDCRDKELITPTSCQPVDADGVGTCPPPPCCDDIKPKNECTIGSLPSVEIKSGIKLSKDAQSILDAAASQIKANPNCKIAVVGHGAASKRAQQLSWDRVEAVINYLVEKQGISRDRFVFKYGEEGDANTVDLRDATGEDGPNMVPAPHPQYRK